jgi:hypothetical protein
VRHFCFSSLNIFHFSFSRDAPLLTPASRGEGKLRASTQLARRAEAASAAQAGRGVFNESMTMNAFSFPIFPATLGVIEQCVSCRPTQMAFQTVLGGHWFGVYVAGGVGVLLE